MSTNLSNRIAAVKPPESDIAKAVAKLPPIYYDAGRKEYLHRAADKTWLRLAESMMRRELRLAGIGPKPPKDEIVSPMDRVLSYLTLNRNVAYAAPLAGHHAGLIESGGHKILVTESPQLIEPKSGPFPLLDGIVRGLFPPEDGIGEIQLDTFCAWLRVAVDSLRAGKRQPGQALAIAGPVECGKTLLQTVITWALGGRHARPYRYMTGATDFNSELFAAEHLVIDDEQASRDMRTRVSFAASLKQFTVSDGARFHAKFQTPVELKPFWRVTITLNDEPESLAVLPPITDDIADKIILLRAQRVEMPMPTQTPDEREAFSDALKAELPAFLHHVCSQPIPAALVSQRFGVKHFHHPEILESLSEMSPELRLLNIIDVEIFGGPIADPWSGSALELEHTLTTGTRGAEARKLLSWDNATGTYLGRLKNKAGKTRVDFSRNKHSRVWTIQPPLVTR